MTAKTNWKVQMDELKAHKNAASHYSYELDCLVELIQNSFKSIQQRQKEEKNLAGEIEIKVNIAEKKITIIDNGLGFPIFEQSLGIGKTGWKKISPEAGFGYGLTSMIMMSDFAQINSVTTEKIWRKISFVDSYQKFWGTKTQQSSKWEEKERWGPQPSKGEIKTTIALKGKKRAYAEFWDLMTKWSSFENDDGTIIPQIKLLEQALLWHSALGYSRILWGNTTKTPNIKYKITVKPKKGDTKTEPKHGWRKVGHPLSKIPAKHNKFDVLNNTGTKDTLSVLTANKVCNTVTIPRLDNAKVKIRIHAISMIGEDGDDVISKMKDRFDEFPLYHYSSDRYFLSINGFNQAIRLHKPDKGGNKQIHNNALFVIDIENVSGLDFITESGRSKLAYGLEKVVEDRVYTHAVAPLDKAQLGKIKEKFSGGDSREAAKEHLKDNPWPWTSSADLGISAGPRLPNDEGYVVNALGMMIGNGLVTEIEPITIGKSSDTYDMLFYNKKPAAKLTAKQLTKLKIKPPLAGQTHADGKKPMIGELKTTLSGFCQDIDKDSTPKKGSDVQFLVCWERGKKLPDGWLLKPREIGLGVVRCSNYTLKKGTLPGQPSVNLEVLVLSEYLKEHHEALLDNKKRLDAHKTDPTKNMDPGSFNWPNLA